MKKLLLIVLICSSCVTRKQINAVIWMNNFNDKDNSMLYLCEREPELYQRGFYRKLNDGKIEFISICNKEASNFYEVYKDDFKRIMDSLPK